MGILLRCDNFTVKFKIKGMKNILLLIFFAYHTHAACQHLSPKAQKLEYLYEQLEVQLHAPILQVQYIQEFPDTKTAFIELFNAHTEDELARDGVAYVKKFRKLGYDYPDSVLPKAIAIGKELPAWSAGVVDELQKTIYSITGKNPALFATYVKELKKDEQASLATFLYTSPNGRNPNYDILIDIFDRAGQPKIKKIFINSPTEQIEE